LYPASFYLSDDYNFGFFYGDIDNPELHSVYELFVALVVSLITTVLKIGDKTQFGAVLLATSLVADIQLLAAVIVWTVTEYLSIVDVEAFAANNISIWWGSTSQYKPLYTICWRRPLNLQKVSIFWTHHCLLDVYVN